jgi:hypothetical protein
MESLMGIYDYPSLSSAYGEARLAERKHTLDLLRLLDDASIDGEAYMRLLRTAAISVFTPTYVDVINPTISHIQFWNRFIDEIKPGMEVDSSLWVMGNDNLTDTPILQQLSDMSYSRSISAFEQTQSLIQWNLIITSGLYVLSIIGNIWLYRRLLSSKNMMLTMFVNIDDKDIISILNKIPTCLSFIHRVHLAEAELKQGDEVTEYKPHKRVALSKVKKFSKKIRRIGITVGRGLALIFILSLPPFVRGCPFLV